MKFSFIFDYMDYIDNVFEKKDIDDLFIYEQFSKNFISEGLIKTQPAEKTVKIIKNRFDVSIQIGDDGEIHIWDLKHKPEFYLPIINNLGYFIASNFIGGKWYNYTDNIVSGEVTDIIIEPKYDEIVESLPDVLYHTTLCKNDDRISKVGLVPRSANKIASHPDRVYFTKDLDIAHRFGKYLEEYDDEGYGEYTIWKVNTKGLNFKLYSDVNFRGNGFYTTSNIPPQNLEIEYSCY